MNEGLLQLTHIQEAWEGLYFHLQWQNSGWTPAKYFGLLWASGNEFAYKKCHLKGLVMSS